MKRAMTWKWWVVPLLIAALLLTACADAGDTDGDVVEPIEETPLVDDTAVVIETPLVEETAIVEETPMVEETAVLATEPAAETPMVQPTAPALTEGQALLMQSSTLVGMNIVDLSGTEVAQVSDVLVDQDGQIRFIVFDAGGFLGIGERVTAVEWSAFQPAPQNTEGNLLLIVDAEELEESPVFDMEGVEPDSIILNTDGTNLPAEFDGLIRVGGTFTDFNLFNGQGEDLGEVEDMIFDLNAGQVLYGLVDFGGFLGLAENTVAVPWERFDIQEQGEDEGAVFFLNVDEAVLEDAPTFEADQWPLWPNVAEEGFAEENQAFWDTAPEAQAGTDGQTGDQPMLIESSTLVGMPVVTAADGEAEATTEVSDILVAEDGTIAYVILDSGQLLGADLGIDGPAAVAWDAFEPDPANERLLLNADMTGMETMVTPFDETGLNGDGLIDTEEAGTLGLTGDFEQLIRMGGALQDFQIVSTTTNEDIGEVEQAIIDLNAGRAEYAVADFGGFLGVAEHTVAVPWDRLQVVPAAADEAGATFGLAVTPETIENAPTYDAGAWTMWPQPADPDFDAETETFWETAG